MARRRQDLIERIASEYEADSDATSRILKHLIDHLPSLHTSSVKLGARDRFAYALDVLINAYRALGPRKAHRLFQPVDLHTLETRMAAAEYLVEGSRDGKLPLYSLEELADRLVGFRRFLSDDRKHLLSTGLPSRFYKPCRWLWYRTANLYATRRTTDRLPFEEPIRVKGKPTFYKWARFRRLEVGSELKPCSFKAADPVAGITFADEARLIHLRGRLLKAKMAVLGRIATCLRQGNASSLLPTCVEAIRELLTDEEIAFCFRCDGIYSHVPRNPPRVHPFIASLGGLPRPVAPGGLTSIFEIVEHAEKELIVGTMRRTREALGDVVVERHADNVLDVSDQPGSYFALIAGGRRRIVDKALDGFVSHDDLEGEFWSGFRKRLRTALKTKGDQKAAIEIGDPESFAERLQAMIEASVKRAITQLQIADTAPLVDVPVTCPQEWYQGLC